MSEKPWDRVRGQRRRNNWVQSVVSRKSVNMPHALEKLFAADYSLITTS